MNNLLWQRKIARLNKAYNNTDNFNNIIIIIITIISIFKEDNIFSIIARLPYGPPVNTDIDYYQTFFIFVSVAMLVVQYLLGEEKPVLAL